MSQDSRWKVARLAVPLLGLLFAAGGPLAGQTRQVYSVRIDSVSGTPVALRVLAHRALLAEGLSVREVAACDCLLTTDPMRGLASQPVEVRIHIIRAPSAVFARNAVILEALVGAPGGDLARGGAGQGAPPAAVARLLDRLKDLVQRNQLPLEVR